MNELSGLLALAVALVNLALLIWLLVRKPPDAGRAELLAANERSERELRREISESSRGARQELTQAFATFQHTLVMQSA